MQQNKVLPFVRAVVLSAIAAGLAAVPAFAAGSAFDYVSIDGEPVERGMRPMALFPDQPVEICFEGTFYTYLSARFEEVAVHFWWEDERGAVPDYTLETIDVIDPQQFDRVASEWAAISRCFRWRAPAQPGYYDLYSHRLPIVNEPAAFRTEESRRRLAVENRTEQHGSTLLGAIEVPEDARPAAIPYSVGLTINDRRPGAAETIDGGVSDEALEIAWDVRKDPAISDLEVEAQYSLYPSEDWTPWTSGQIAVFDYVLRGAHEFRLRTRYRTGGSDWIEVPAMSKIGFVVQETLIAPISSKGLDRVDGAADAVDASWIDAELYGRSRAFLAGVQYYDNDADFGPLPYVDNDLDEVAEALEGVGFTDIADPILNGDRATILDALQNFIEATEEGDRIVLYFSMHGFESGTDRQNPYLATRDCDPSPLRARTNCLPLSDLEEMIRYAVGTEGADKKAQHVLVILDACSVGMGIVRKSGDGATRFVERGIAEIPGAHIMTAGLAGQDAFVDNSEQISFFTRALAKGLKGAADVYQDQVITLSELEVYVRRQVALATDSKQTPMVGDIAGAGQIIFRAPGATTE